MESTLNLHVIQGESDVYERYHGPKNLRSTYHLSLGAHHSRGSTKSLRTLKQQTDPTGDSASRKKENLTQERTNCNLKDSNICLINAASNRWPLGSNLPWTPLVSLLALSERERNNISRKTAKHITWNTEQQIQPHWTSETEKWKRAAPINCVLIRKWGSCSEMCLIPTS